MTARRRPWPPSSTGARWSRYLCQSGLDELRAWLDITIQRLADG
ncbi:hypothetical protein [Kineosporia mesophila]|nr:hypothetical protein [Kineosporia mesophila]